MDKYKKKKHSQYIKQIYRVVSYYLAEKLINTSITANQVTLSRMLLIVVASMLILNGDYMSHLSAAFLIILFSMFDALDGSLAIIKDECSVLGTWLDPQIDRLGFLLLFLFIAYYLSSSSELYIYLTMYTLLIFYFRGLIPHDIRLKDKFILLRDSTIEKESNNQNDIKESSDKRQKGLFYQLKLQTSPHTHNVAMYIAIGLIFQALELVVIFLSIYLTLWYIWENYKVINKAKRVDQN